MRVLHTSDWHLGHHLHNVPRTHEHAAFLDWLLQALQREKVDVLIIAGDIFETSNPPAHVWRRWYGFLAEITRRQPHLQVVAVGGNHDSPGRLEAPNPLLHALNVTVIGAIPRLGTAMDRAAMCIPLKNRDGEVAAWCAAMPFIRVCDLPARSPQSGQDPLIEGVRRLYDELFEYVFAQKGEDRAVIATGHCYMAKARESEPSERKILGGNLHALPANLFPDDLAYVALGHLHRHQRVGGHSWIRYSGSPIPLSFSENKYRHQACLIELDGARLLSVRELPIPRFVPMIQLPAAPIDEVLATISELDPLPEDMEPYLRPFLEVTVRLPKPRAQVRRHLEAALEGRAPRLLKITIEYTGDGLVLGDREPKKALEHMMPEDVFLSCWRRHHHGEPPPELHAMFHELLDRVHREGL